MILELIVVFVICFLVYGVLFLDRRIRHIVESNIYEIKRVNQLENEIRLFKESKEAYYTKTQELRDAKHGCLAVQRLYNSLNHKVDRADMEESYEPVYITDMDREDD